MTKISDILNSKGSNVFTIKPDSSVYDAVRLMVEKNVGALLVTSNNDIQGIITERDYLRRIVQRGLNLSFEEADQQNL